MKYTALIEDVNSKTINRKSDGKTITLYEITDGQKNPTTSRRDLANEAYHLRGKMADIEVRVEQNGVYENVYLENVRPAVASAQPPRDPFPEPEDRPPLPRPPRPEPEPEIPRQGQNGHWSEDKWSVFRQTATKVAAHTSANANEFWQNVDQLVAYYATGISPNLEPIPGGVTSYAPAEGAQQAQRNRFVPEEAIASQAGNEGYEHNDDDIPF